MQYYGLLDHSGRPVVSQGPRDPRLQKLEAPGEFLDTATEKAFRRIVGRWSSTLAFDPSLSEEDLLQFLRSKHPSGDPVPDWHTLTDWVRGYLRRAGYHATGKGHFLEAPEVEKLDDGPQDPGDLAQRARKWFLTGIFWSYLEEDPELKQKLVDITETQSWDERAALWGYDTRGGAQRYAHTVLRKRLLGVASGKAARVLSQLQR